MGTRNPIKMKARTGGENGSLPCPLLAQNIAEGKTSYELSLRFFFLLFSSGASRLSYFSCSVFISSHGVFMDLQHYVGFNAAPPDLPRRRDRARTNPPGRPRGLRRTIDRRNPTWRAGRVEPFSRGRLPCFSLWWGTLKVKPRPGMYIST